MTTRTKPKVKKKIPWTRASTPSTVVMKDGTTYQRFQRVHTDITPAEMNKLEEAWSFEWPDTQACEYAGITYVRLQNAYRRDPLLRNKREILHNHPEYYAKKNIANSIKTGDLNTSRWFLERRVKEYASKSSMDIAVNHTLTVEQIEAKLTKLLGHGNTDLIEYATEQPEEYHDVIDAELEPVVADDVGGAEAIDLDMLLS